MHGTVRLTLALGLAQLIAWGTTFYLPAVVLGVAAPDLGLSRAGAVGAFSWALVVSGLCAPRMGRWIERRGGRGVLATGTVLLACGLAVLAAARGPFGWYAGWTVLGVGMALALYDAAFATVGRLLGTASGSVITGITLIAGFASSVFWPAGVALVHRFGWRTTLLAYGGMLLAVNLPLILLLVPRAGLPGAIAAARATGAPIGRRRVAALACLSGFFSLRWLITSAIAVYVLHLFQALGLGAGQAVFAAALIGPGQVLGRVVDWSVGRRFGVLARARLAAVLLPAGVAVLALGGAAPMLAVPLFAVLYGMSNGILSINRGTLPMAIFGPVGYAALLGWLAVPPLLAQAAAPSVAAPLVAAVPALGVFVVAGVVGVAAGALLLPLRVGGVGEG
ncbi:MAG: MFS transporter [Proteobacteria bacterium]|nr:MFS transporter [Pseudomonadota bacterium]